MSTILKALRRLEDDRSVHEQRPLRETVAAGGSADAAKGSGGRAGWIVALVVLLAAGGGAGYLAFQSAVEPEASQAAATSSPAAESEPERYAAAPTEVTPRIEDSDIVPPGEPYEPDAYRAGELPEAAFSSPVERLDRPLPGPRIADSPPRTPEPAPVPDEQLVTGEGAPTTTRLVRGQPLVPPSQLPGRQPIAPRRDSVTRVEPGPSVPARTAEPPPAEPERRAPTAVPARQVTAEPPAARPTATSARTPVVASQPAPEVARATPSPVATPDPRPSRVEVKSVPAPPEPAPVVAAKATPTPSAPEAKPASETSVVRASVPDLLVAGTSWHPTAARRTATVQIGSDEIVEVHEGDAVGPLVVSRIEPSSVVFRHEGIEIRRRIGQR